jgi:hypothetical protein
MQLRTKAQVGPDKCLHIQLPADAIEGDVDVTLLIEPHRVAPTPEQRRRAAGEGRGMLKPSGLTVAEFLRERLEDDARRERALDEAMGIHSDDESTRE